MATISTATTYYTIEFSDPTAHTALIATNNNANTSTSLVLPGPNYRNFGVPIAENFLHLLENFSSDTAPYPPVQGQLWYDSAELKLKINKSGNPVPEWVPANGIYQQDTLPFGPAVGDIWVDTIADQLKIYSVSGWTNVGPMFNAGVITGSSPETIIDTRGVYHQVIKNYVNGDVITIIANDKFTPASVIDGFDTLFPGVNLTANKFNDTTAKLNGVATSAAALLVTNPALSGPTTGNLSADSFVRTTEFNQTILGTKTFSTAIQIGDTLINKSSVDAIVRNTRNDAKIIFKTIKSTITATSLTLNGNMIGINNEYPTVALDVVGNVSVVGSISTTGTIYTNNIVITGTSTFSSSLILGNITTRDVVPITTNTYNIGSTSTYYKTVYGQRFAGSADTLTVPVTLNLGNELSGHADISGTSTSVTMSVNLTPFAISGRDSTSTATSNDQLLILRSGVLKKITKSNFLSSLMPIGAIVAYPDGGLAPVPTGWLPCNGGYITFQAYPELCNIIGSTYQPQIMNLYFLPAIPPLATGIQYIIKAA